MFRQYDGMQKSDLTVVITMYVLHVHNLQCRY